MCALQKKGIVKLSLTDRAMLLATFNKDCEASASLEKLLDDC